MIGLIIKDILVNKKYLYVTVGVTLFYILYGIMLNNINFFISFLMLFGFMFILSSFAYDDMAGWDMYVLSMPTSKNQIVFAKYLLSLLFILLASIISILVNVITEVFKNNSVSKEAFITIWIYIGIALLFDSIQIPLVIKLGSEKARYAILAIIFIPTLLFMFIRKLGKLNILKQIAFYFYKYSDLLLKISPFIILLILFLSLKLSIYFYSKKEF